jgi:hypothetical protein
MLTEEESLAFLALLLEFQSRTHAGVRQMAALFDVTGKTMIRWLHAARAGEAIPLYHCYTDHIAEDIRRMNALDAAEGVYATLPRSVIVSDVDALHALSARAAR